jgi:hypothetical protein
MGIVCLSGDPAARTTTSATRTTFLQGLLPWLQLCLEGEQGVETDEAML